MGHFTLHIRLTKNCNADCSYCSSRSENLDIMSRENFSRSINFLCTKVFPKIISNYSQQDTFLTIQYVGGEIGIVPYEDLEWMVKHARTVFGKHFRTVVDGVQTNLISSRHTTQKLINLFGSRLGTSIDGQTGQRKLQGSAKKYNLIFEKNIEAVKREFNHPPSIYVLDKLGIKFLSNQIDYCLNEGVDLTLRPVFQGGSKVASCNVSEIETCLENLFKEWAMKMPISIQPFSHLLGARLQEDSSSCPFQSNCSRVSLDLEPNGDLYTCLDMADSDQFVLGNALAHDFNHEVWKQLAKRALKLPKDCTSCEYLDSCQGGCMSESIHHTESPYGKTYFCSIWKTLFSQIDELIAINGREEVKKWYKTIV